MRWYSYEILIDTWMHEGGGREGGREGGGRDNSDKGQTIERIVRQL